jgi:hypothetical protein
MNLPSIQFQLADSIKTFYKGSIVKKVDKDNYLDIHIPSVNKSKATHLFFNTAKDQIKLGFYVRDIEFINKVLVNSSDKIESNSQGIRLKNNPVFNSVEEGINAAKDLLNYIDLTIQIPITKKSIPIKKVIYKPSKLKSVKHSESDDSIKTIIFNDKSKNITSQHNLKYINWFYSFLNLFTKLLARK